MTDFTGIAQRYVEAWNETDAVKRQARIEELFTADATYTDPLGAATGVAGIDGFIAAAQRQYAGLRFSLGGVVDGHHDIARFQWHLGPDGAPEPPAIGFDVIQVEDGRIARVLGFLDKIPG